MSQMYVGNSSEVNPPQPDLHASRYIVSAGGAADGANYTTISSAYAAAVSAGEPQTVFIQPGFYFEDIVLQPKINLSAFGSDSGLNDFNTDAGGCVVIIGKLSTVDTSPTDNVTVYGIVLQSSSDYFLEVEGTSTICVNLVNCYLLNVSHTGIHFTNSNSSTEINILYCGGTIQASSGISLFSHSSAGTLNINYSEITKPGPNVFNSTVSSGNLSINHSTLNFPITSSGTSAVEISHSSIDNSNNNATSLTLGGSGAHSVSHSTINSGSASAISISNTTTLDLCDINSSNTNAITGSGTVGLAGIVFTGSSSGVNTNTVNSLPFLPSSGGSAAGFSAYLSGNVSNFTGDGTDGTVIFNATSLDTASGFNTGSGVYTFPYTGTWLITGSIFLFNLGAAHNQLYVSLNTTSGANNLYISNPNLMSAVGSTELQVPFSIQIQVAATNTAFIAVEVAGGTKTVGLGGAIGGMTFSGVLLTV